MDRLKSNRQERLGAALAWWVRNIQKRAIAVLLVTIAITFALTYYVVTTIGIDTDTSDMLSGKLTFRKNYENYRAAFPQYDSTFLILVEGDTPDLAQDASLKLSAALKKEKDYFTTVYLPGGGQFFEEHAFLYLSPEELESLADRLARVQPFLAKLSHDLSVQGFLAILQKGLEESSGNDVSFDFKPIFQQVRAAIDATTAGKRHYLSWMALMGGDSEIIRQKYKIIVVQPVQDFTELTPAARAINEVHRIIRELRLDGKEGVTVRVTGDVAMENQEIFTVMRGAGIAGTLAILMVSGLLFLGLRSVRFVLSTLATLIMGLIWTAGFAAFAVGNLNLISIAFAILYIGLSVDYAIHFILRYKELLQQGMERSAALSETARDIGSSLTLCALTTSIGFYAFTPTSYSGVAELGLISGTGMFIALIANLTILPALLYLFPVKRFSAATSNAKQHSDPGRSSFPLKYRTSIRIVSLVIGLAAIFLLPQVRFDDNPLNLRNPDTEPVEAFRDLLKRGGSSPWSLSVLAPGQRAAKDLARKLEKLKLVEKCVVLDDFVPTEQNAKLQIIDDIALMMGPDVLKSGPPDPDPPGDTGNLIKTIAGFVGSLNEFCSTTKDEILKNEAASLRNSFQALLKEARGLGAKGKTQLFELLTSNLLTSLPGRLQTLRNSLKAGETSLDELPPDLISRWKTRDGRYRVEVFPRDDLNDHKAMVKFIKAVHGVAPDAIGFPVIIYEGGKAVVAAFQEALLYSFIAITLLLLLLVRRISDVVLMLVPLLLAAVLTGAGMVLLGIPFNFANVIALPLLFGIGVDNGIHMTHRLRAAANQNQILKTSTAKAVLYSTLTTICGFGNLALSPHRGMASMGLLLTIGIGMILFCTLIVLPALFPKQTPR